MGLHNHILESSDELKSDMSDFSKIARCASKKPQMLWPTLSARDAPRALSDTLLAVAAAVFLDTNWSTFQKLFDPFFQAHVLDTMLQEQMTSADGGLAASGDPVAHLQRLAGSVGLSMEVHFAGAELVANQPDLCRGRTFDTSGLSPDTSSTPPSGLRDVHVCSLWIGGIQVGPPVAAASPRSATRRCASLAAPGLTAVSLSSLKTLLVQLQVQASSAMVSQESVRNLLIEYGVLKEKVGTGQLIVHLPNELDPHLLGEKAATILSDVEQTLHDYTQGITDTGTTEGEGMWCNTCGIWCNGPAQFRDHEGGQPHKKVIKNQSTKANKDTVLLATIPKISKQIEFPNKVSDDAKSSTSGHSALVKMLDTTSSTDSTTKVVPVGCDDSGGTGSGGGGLAATSLSPPPAPQTMKQNWHPNQNQNQRRDGIDRDRGGSGHSSQQHTAVARTYSYSGDWQARLAQTWQSDGEWSHCDYSTYSGAWQARQAQTWQSDGEWSHCDYSTHGYYTTDGYEWLPTTTTSWHGHDW
jgi:hypothetical protein